MTDQNSTNAALARNILFQLVMQEPDILQGFICFSTGKSVRLVPPIEYEKTITLDTDKKGVRFDIHAIDEEGTIYDIEMENNGKHLKSRLRYYQSMMNINMLTKGNIYNEMKATKIIVVCSFDPYNEARYVSQVDKVYRHNPELLFNDGEEIILLNSKGTIGDIPEELKEFFMLINGEYDAESLKTAFAKNVYKKMIEVLKSKKYEEATMWLQAELMESKMEGLEAGILVGTSKGANDTLEALKMHKLGYSKDEIIAATGVSAENIDKMIEILG